MSSFFTPIHYANFTTIFTKNLTEKIIEISLLILLLPTNKQPTQQTQMAMTIEQLAKAATLLKEKARIEAELAEVELEIKGLQLMEESEEEEGEGGRGRKRLREGEESEEEEAVWNEKAKTPPASEDEDA